jgi:hypothetical protein
MNPLEDSLKERLCDVPLFRDSERRPLEQAGAGVPQRQFERRRAAARLQR